MKNLLFRGIVKEYWKAVPPQKIFTCSVMFATAYFIVYL